MDKPSDWMETPNAGTLRGVDPYAEWKKIQRTAEMQSAIMADHDRNGGWPGAQKVADAFADLAERITTIISAARGKGPRETRLEEAIQWCLDRDQRNGSLPEFYAIKLRAALEGAPPPAEIMWGDLLGRWRESQFETTADEAAQSALDDQAVGLDVAPIIEAWLKALSSREKPHV